MARGGINKALVQKARESLLARGEHPSIDAVRAELGNTGSKTTIHRYLKELDDSDPLQSGTPKALSEELGELVSRLAARLQEEAGSALKAAEAAFAAERAGLLVRLERDRLRIAELDRQRSELEQALGDEQASLRQSRDQAQQMQVELARLDQLQRDQKQRLEERDARIASLEEKHRHAREALEHYRNAVKEQREQEQRRHEGQVQQLQLELRQSQQTLIVKQDAILQLNRDNERLLGELRSASREQSALQERISRQTQEQADQQAQLIRLDTRNAGLQERLGQLEQEQAAMRAAAEQAVARHGEQIREQQLVEQSLRVDLARIAAELRLLRAGAGESQAADAPGEEG